MKVFVDRSDIKRFDVNSFKCVDDENNIRVFEIIKDKELQDKMIYMFSDEDFAKRVDLEYIKEMVKKGMRTLSEREEPKKLLNDLISMTENRVGISEIENQGNIIEKGIREVGEKAIDN